MKKRSNFTLLLTLAIVMVIGAALMPLVDVADSPRPRQGKTLQVWYGWNGASAQVVEQNVTSRLEGLIAAVRDVKNVSSESYFGSGRISIELKPEANVSATKFEIASLLRQVHKQLPEGVSYPELSGGEVVNRNVRKETTQLLLSYRVNSRMSDEQLKEYIHRQVEPQMRQLEEVKYVEVTGGKSKYIVITYDPLVLAGYGLGAHHIEKGIQAFLGKVEIVGDWKAPGQQERRTLYLVTQKFAKPLDEMPIGMVGQKMVYLNDLATYEYKDRLPNEYYRVNGLSTIYLNFHVDAEANRIKLSRNIQEKIAEMEKGMKDGVYLTLSHDAAKEKETELHKLVWRSLLSLFILMGFVWLVRRDWRYLALMAVTLAANVLTAVIGYYVFDIRLHIYSLAGITVSLGMIIDAAVVMVDHYSYHHDRKAFLAILAALLTTIASLIVVLWLPDFLQKDLYDFAWIIIINLCAALLVAWLFVPALVDRMNYHSRQVGQVRHRRLASGWTRFYMAYVRFTQKHKWVYVLLIVWAFGVPFHLLPPQPSEDDTLYDDGKTLEKVEEPWWTQAYNATLGSNYFQFRCKDKLSNLFGGTMKLFSETTGRRTYGPNPKREKILHIRGKMPLGGTAAQLNDKIQIVENFLAGFDEIERFETRVGNWGGNIDVKFKDEVKNTSFPYILENKVVGKLIGIGGADWSTSGVSERGFSNALFLQARTFRIELMGYNYERLQRYAEDLCDEMRKNDRVSDLVIEVQGHEYQPDELYMRYDRQRMALYGFDVYKAHSTLREMLQGKDIERYRDHNFSSDMYLKSAQQDRFDLWHLNNAYLRDGQKVYCLSDFMDIEKREAKNCIPRRNQEYVLQVAYNLLGSYTYCNDYNTELLKNFRKKLPVGFRCQNKTFGFYEDDGTQYWLLGLIIVIIFFVCSVLFESLRKPLAIISLIPISFIGTFLTYWLTEVEFGSGGFASMVLLAGLTVNAGIYIVCEYNSQQAAFPRVNALRTYIRAYNHKITAVMLTIASTVLGLVPFFIDGDAEPFWFSFAVGSTGGLLFSIVALIFAMPIFLNLSVPDAGAKKPKRTLRQQWAAIRQRIHR